MDKAKLFNMKMPFEVVVFDFNPSTMTMSKETADETRGNASSSGGMTGPLPAGNRGGIWRGTMRTSLKFKAVLTGPSTKKNIDQLLAWTQPGGSFLGAMVGAAVGMATGGRVNLAVNTPILTFQWGPPGAGFYMDCKMKSCSATIKRFDDAGVPLFAECDIGLKEDPNFLATMLTNPTSGGLPGRESHTVTEGETLQGIATERYGHPGVWREIADANGIDDPLRIRPGDRVFLPSPNEVLERAGARPGAAG